jgi:hypothetical protein
VARGTVVGWASRRDTGFARMRWWVTGGSLPLGAARGQAESRPGVTPSRPLLSALGDPLAVANEMPRAAGGDSGSRRRAIVSCILDTWHV